MSASRRPDHARNTIFDALLRRSGPEAFAAMRRAAAAPIFSNMSHRLLELTHLKAEQDSEAPPWAVADVLTFERQHSAAVKTGADLLRLVTGVLSDIQLSFTKADASSRELLLAAPDEKPVQKWLLEQLQLRADERYHAHREPEVAGKNLPDIIVSSTSAAVEVAIEVKHGGMDWSARDFDKSLRSKLAEDYLRPECRRHGVLFITHHGRRSWRHPTSRSPLTFPLLIEWLADAASQVVRNRLGDIEVRVFGLDVSSGAARVEAIDFAAPAHARVKARRPGRKSVASGKQRRSA